MCRIVLTLFHHLLPQRPSHRTRTAARGRGVPQGRQCFPRGGRCPSSTGGSRPPQPPDHSSAARSLDWGGRAEVFPERPSGPQPHSPLLPAASRIRSQLRLPTELPHPQTLRALLRPRAVPPHGQQALSAILLSPPPENPR